jgi:hypothetical protein
MFVFVLGTAAACNSLLGYDQNFELVKDASVESSRQEGSGDATDEQDGADDAESEGARDANLADAVDEDAAAPAGDGGQGADDGDADAGSSMAGVPCGDQSCSSGFACCYKSPTLPQNCAPPFTCSSPSFVACDGPEDCGGGACCVVSPAPSSFAALCHDSAICPVDRATVCHVGAAGCNCKPNGCYPVPTCDGLCD